LTIGEWRLSIEEEKARCKFRRKEAQKAKKNKPQMDADKRGSLESGQ
jgi:hypothetical protein